MKTNNRSLKNITIKEMVGLKIKWDDPDPFNATDHLVNCEISHTNKIRNLRAAEIYKIFQTACADTRMYYRFGITVVFKYDNVECYVDREIMAFCLVSEINDYALDQITEAMREGDESKYSHVTFIVECLSDKAPQKTVEQRLIEKLSATA